MSMRIDSFSMRGPLIFMISIYLHEFTQVPYVLPCCALKNALRKINAESIPIQFQFNVVARLGKVNSMSMRIDIFQCGDPLIFHIDFSSHIDFFDAPARPEKLIRFQCGIDIFQCGDPLIFSTLTLIFRPTLWVMAIGRKS